VKGPVHQEHLRKVPNPVPTGKIFHDGLSISPNHPPCPKIIADQEKAADTI
jgi:hypothetical protein